MIDPTEEQELHRRLTALPEQLQARTGIPFNIAIARRPLAAAQLSARERRRYPAKAGAARRRAWLCGRAALRQLAADLDRHPRDADVAFPHPRLSLTHSGAWAVAIGHRDDNLRGIGIDLELRPPVREAAARFFLNSAERAAIAALGKDRRREALGRLWVIKEALFKSDPRNRGRMLLDYGVDDIGAATGWARRPGNTPNGSLYYAAFDVPGGHLAVSLMTRKADLAPFSPRERGWR